MAGSMVRLDSWSKVYGSPVPLGATWIESAGAWNFALYSTEAIGVRLLIYSAADLVRPLKSYDLDARLNKTIRVWHVLVPAAEVPGATYYAFKVSGPNDPAKGLLFDAGKGFA